MAGPGCFAGERCLQAAEDPPTLYYTLSSSFHADTCLSHSSIPAFRRVHEHNIDALMVAALPYHSTPEFVRLLQVLALDPKRGLWHWLEKAQAPGAALPREVLVARCINDAAVLGFVCDAARKLGSAEIASKAYLSFYAVTLCEVVAGVQVSGWLGRVGWNHGVVACSFIWWGGDSQQTRPLATETTTDCHCSFLHTLLSGRQWMRSCSPGCCPTSALAWRQARAQTTGRLPSWLWRSCAAGQRWARTL